MKEHNIKLVAIYVLFLVALALVSYFMNDLILSFFEWLTNTTLIKPLKNLDDTIIIAGILKAFVLICIYAWILISVLTLITIGIIFIHKNLYKMHRNCNKKLFLILYLSPSIIIFIMNELLGKIDELKYLLQYTNITFLTGSLLLGISTIFVYIKYKNEV